MRWKCVVHGSSASIFEGKRLYVRVFFKHHPIKTLSLINDFLKRKNGLA